MALSILLVFSTKLHIVPRNGAPHQKLGCVIVMGCDCEEPFYSQHVTTLTVSVRVTSWWRASYLFFVGVKCELVAAINPEVESLFGMCITSALLIELIKSILRGKKVEKLRLRALACRWSESIWRSQTHEKAWKQKYIYARRHKTAKKISCLIISKAAPYLFLQW